jgi:hypothetical protein
MTIPYFPIGVDVARLQSEVDLMEQFLRFPSFNVESMVMGS